MGSGLKNTRVNGFRQACPKICVKYARPICLREKGAHRYNRYTGLRHPFPRPEFHPAIRTRPHRAKGEEDLLERRARLPGAFESRRLNDEISCRMR
jgi:hypothetical protein